MLTNALSDQVLTATRAIAPAWPLDRSIAVNPLWERVDRSMATAAQEVATRGGFELLMPRSWFQAEWASGRLTSAHLHEAVRTSDTTIKPSELLSALDQATPETPRRARVTDIADSYRDLLRQEAWADYVPHHISQFCADAFSGEPPASLYRDWRARMMTDRGPALRMGAAAFRAQVAALPEDPEALIQAVIAELQVPEREVTAYLESLLLDVNGWASWCAYLRWTARLAGKDDDTLVELLAIRLAWEKILIGCVSPTLLKRFKHAMARWPEVDRHAMAARRVDWLLQRAVEVAWQQGVLAQLGTAPEAGVEAPAVQAVFCIDVRSEVYRRALEAEGPAIHTLGFAGFFGLPAVYVPAGSATARPQLPGLLSPRFQITDTGVSSAGAARRSERRDADLSWKKLKSAPSSTFGFVEGAGLGFAARLLLDGMGWSPSTGDAADRPRLTGKVDGSTLTVAEKGALAEGILRGMSLTSGFARLLLLTGHAAETRNNPHAAGLDCGACCGQSGEVNARAVAALLNEPEVRLDLAGRGISLPSDTHVLPGLHNTTTDEVRLFDLDEVPASHQADVDALIAQLRAAGQRARQERAPRLGIREDDDAVRLAALQQRARGWASVRPEWGLAGNAGFVVARRSAIRHLNLAGRAFLHEYRHEQDAGYRVLEGILTAPMLVAHWINLQYYASTVDNRHLGSGDKTLHNVVGGHIGVFEGNGGDLRIGLPLQCVHDGTAWVHAPLRLSVFVEAPAAAVQGIVARHQVVRSLLDNGWLTLTCLDLEQGSASAYRGGETPWEVTALA